MKHRARSVLLTSCISMTNKGTASIIISTIESLQAVMPDLRIFVELFYPEVQRKIASIEDGDVRIVPAILQSSLKAAVTLGLAVLWLPIRLVGLRLPFPSQALNRYQSVDAVIHLGAECFVVYYDDDLFQQMVRFGAHLYPIFLGLLLGKPVVLYAQTLAPFGIFKPIMKFILTRVALVTVRDPTSLVNLKREGVDISKVHLTADPAFLLEPQQPPYCPEKRGIGPLIGLSAARQTGRTLGAQQYECLLQTLSETAGRLIQELDATIVFVPHSSGKLRKVSDDVLVGLEMQEQVANDERFTVLTEDWPPQYLKGFIGQCDALLTFRMHPAIAALSMGVPSVIIAFNNKAIGLMQRLGLEHYVCQIDEMSVDQLTQLMTNCLADSEAIQCDLPASMDRMRNLASQNAILVRDWLMRRTSRDLQ